MPGLDTQVLSCHPAALVFMTLDLERPNASSISIAATGGQHLRQAAAKQITVGGTLVASLTVTVLLW